MDGILEGFIRVWFWFGGVTRGPLKVFELVKVARSIMSPSSGSWASESESDTSSILAWFDIVGEVLF